MAFRILFTTRVPNTDKEYIKAACNAADTKPEGNFAQGSECIEVDTGKTFLFDEDAEAGSKWVDPNASVESETAEE